MQGKGNPPLRLAMRKDRTNMRINEDKWKAAYVSSWEACKAGLVATGPSDGVVCAVASIRLIRDGLIDDVGADQPEAQAIKDGLNELIEQITEYGHRLVGFASNASAASAACKLKDKKEAIQRSGLKE